jgi:GR25 family glycosyltransferase involved in LPS biosynthesis
MEKQWKSLIEKESQLMLQRSRVAQKSQEFLQLVLSEVIGCYLSHYLLFYGCG